MKTALITGGTSGIGKATASLFASRGWKVYALSRRAEEKTEGNITYLKADVTDPESLKKAFSGIERIDAMIHCAGFGIAGSAEMVSLEAARSQMDTNYFGVINTNSFALPLMRQQKSGVVVITGSIAGRISIPFQSHYSSSKFALEAYAEALRNEIKPFGIGVCIVEPGDAKTGFTGSRKYDEPSDSPYMKDMERAVKTMEKDEMNGYGPEKVASVIWKVANRKNPPVRKAVGLSYKALMFVKRLLPDRLVSFIVRKLYL